jgi:hypothetical protein
VKTLRFWRLTKLIVPLHSRWAPRGPCDLLLHVNARLLPSQDYQRDLLRDAAEAKRLEAEKQRQERANRREDFRRVVVGFVASGKVHALSQWAQFKDELEGTPEGAALTGDGVSLQSVFYDVVDQLMSKFKEDKKVGGIVLTVSRTRFHSFADAGDHGFAR